MSVVCAIDVGLDALCHSRRLNQHDSYLGLNTNVHVLAYEKLAAAGCMYVRVGVDDVCVRSRLD